MLPEPIAEHQNLRKEHHKQVEQNRREHQYSKTTPIKIM